MNDPSQQSLSLTDIVEAFFAQEKPCPPDHEFLRLVSLMRETGGEVHAKCGLQRRPCKTCRVASSGACHDPRHCRKAFICWPCQATIRCRIWRHHPLRVRRWHKVAESSPRLLDAIPGELGAEILFVFERYMRRTIRRALHKERAHMAEEIAKLIGG